MLISCRVYAVLAVYLLVCSFWLTGKAFGVRGRCFILPIISLISLQDIPRQLEGKSTSEVILTFFTPPVGALIAAMVSTFGTLTVILLHSQSLDFFSAIGIYFFASFLYVSFRVIHCL